MNDIVFVCADRRELGQDLTDELNSVGIRSLVTGVGKARAAMLLAVELERCSPTRPLVVIVGVAGANRPIDESALIIGQLCWVETDIFADEGVATSSGFLPLNRLSLGSVGPFRCGDSILAELVPQLPFRVVAGRTVSECAGTNSREREYQERVTSEIETMEGASLAMVCDHYGCDWIQLRAVSNYTGDRERGQWDFVLAQSQLAAAVRRLIPCLLERPTA